MASSALNHNPCQTWIPPWLAQDRVSQLTSQFSPQGRRPSWTGGQTWYLTIFQVEFSLLLVIICQHISVHKKWMTHKMKKNDTFWIKQVNMAGRCLQIYARNIKFWSNINLMIQSNIKLNRYVAFVGIGGGGAGLGDIVGLKWPEKIWEFWAGNWKFCEVSETTCTSLIMFRVSVTC